MKFLGQGDTRLEALIEEIDHQVLVMRRLLEDNASLRAALTQLTHPFQERDDQHRMICRDCTRRIDHPNHLTPERALTR